MLGGKKVWFVVGLVIFCAVILRRMRQAYGRETWLENYDFIIVGGGPAGCVLANRLSANPNFTVLLLESGVDYSEGSALIDVPQAAPSLLLSPSHYWSDLSQPHPPGVALGSRDSRASHLHGKILGGSSSINMMMYSRGTAADYDNWESLGATGWSWEHVEPVFKRLENAARNIPKAEKMGDGGPFHVTITPPQHSIYQHLRNASIELGVDITENYNVEGGRFDKNHTDDTVGTAFTQTMAHAGKRWTVVSAYLDPVIHRSNLHIVTRAHVTKILFNDKTAVGVQFTKNSVSNSVACDREVIVSAGVYNSPHLLMLSGVGPQLHVEKNQIEVVHNLPGVGENLQDHAAVSENIFMDPSPGLSMSSQDATFSNMMQYLIKGEGLLAENPFPLMTFLGLNSSDWLQTQYTDKQERNSPDLHLFYGSLMISNGPDPLGLKQAVFDLLNVNTELVAEYMQVSDNARGASVLVSAVRPKSRGNVRLSSNNPEDRPLINTNLLSHPDDIQALKQGLKFVRSMTRTKSLSSVNSYLVDEQQPNRQRFCSDYDPYTDEHLECFVKATVGTVWHGVGTCKMGLDDLSVVDPQLRVHGMRSLRVVDASVMPAIISANTQAATMMIAERAADFILGDHQWRNLTLA